MVRQVTFPYHLQVWHGSCCAIRAGGVSENDASYS